MRLCGSTHEHAPTVPLLKGSNVLMQPIKEYIKPPNQLRLSEADLAEELACTLTAGNPTAPGNIVRFGPKDNAYKVFPPSSAPALFVICRVKALIMQHKTSGRQLLTLPS